MTWGWIKKIIFVVILIYSIHIPRAQKEWQTVQINFQFNDKSKKTE